MLTRGLTMTEATIVEWRKGVGEPVGAGEILLVIETEKAEVEVEAPAAPSRRSSAK